MLGTRGAINDGVAVALFSRGTAGPLASWSHKNCKGSPFGS